MDSGYWYASVSISHALPGRSFPWNLHVVTCNKYFQKSVKYCYGLLNYKVLSKHPLKLIGVGNGQEKTNRKNQLDSWQSRQGSWRGKKRTKDILYFIELLAAPKRQMYDTKAGKLHSLRISILLMSLKGIHTSKSVHLLVMNPHHDH